MTELVHQATCVAIDGRGLLIEGPPGCGKSSLALALIDRGAILVGDDGVILRGDNRELTALPHPNTRGLLEVRGVGLITMPVVDQVPVSLVVHLTSEAPRFVERAPRCVIAGVELPLIGLVPEGAVLPLRAELALQRHGLCRS